jgi:DNA methylase
LKSGRLDELAMHPTVKPVAMIADAIKDVSRRGSVVLDLFGGSGSTVIAAHKTGRRARLCELDPLYCDRILQRWEIFARDDAELIACGVSGRPANDQRVDNRAIEEEVSEKATGEIPIAARRKPGVTAGDGDLATATDPTSHDGSFGSPCLRRTGSL